MPHEPLTIRKADKRLKVSRVSLRTIPGPDPTEPLQALMRLRGVIDLSAAPT